MMSKTDLGPSSRSSSMRPPPDPPTRFPLMTPSASPPIQRPYGRRSDAPSSAKKRRVSRTPSLLGPGARSYSVVSASSSSVSPAFNFDASVDSGAGNELHAARRASSFRVLNVWSQLAGKYARRLDEDDIVDLKKESIVKDYGVLRSSKKMFEIGHFADEHERAQRLDNGQPLTPVDDEPDELDAFADIQDNVSRSETHSEDEVGLELAQQSKRLPPVREVDPADAADLAEFLKAEQQRKVLFGDPDEEEDDEFERIGNGKRFGWERDEEDGESCGVKTTASNSDTERDSVGREHEFADDNEDVYVESVHDADEENNQQDYSRVSTPSGSPEFEILNISDSDKDSENDELIVGAESAAEDHLVASDGDSEDELGGWDQDEGSTLYSVGDFSGGSGDEEEQGTSKENVPSAATPDPSPLPRKGRIRDKRQKISQSTGTPTARATPKTPTKKNVPMSRELSPAPVVQLQTPPRSTSFRPEARSTRITSTYSRKRRGSSSSPKRAPMRIESTVSESSDSEAEGSTFPSNRIQKQKQTEPRSGETPSRKVKLVPEVFIDDRPRFSSGRFMKKEVALRNDRLESLPERAGLTLHRKTAQAEGKVKVTEHRNYMSARKLDTEREPISPEAIDFSDAIPSHVSEGHYPSEFPKRPSTVGSKRRRAPSPIMNDFGETRTADVIMFSPSQTSSRNPTRRTSSSRRSLATSVDSPSEQEAGPSTRGPKSRRALSCHLDEESAESTSRSRQPPELNTFTFTPPQPPSAGVQAYGTDDKLPSLTQQQPSVPIPTFQDPTAQYHLAQALQSLSFLLGSGMSFPLPPVNSSHVPHLLGQLEHQPRPPYTPRHHNRSMPADTPQSTATAPPTSSPLGSDYSESAPSSPIKRLSRDHGRTQTQSHGLGLGRPKSAIRESKTQSRSRSLGQRRVSFSSPEATHIEDHAYDYTSDSVVDVKNSDAGDSDFERRRLRREMQSSRSLQLQPQPQGHIRAQTPGPPARMPAVRSVETDFYQATVSGSEPERRHKKGTRTPEPSRRVNRKKYQ